MATGNKPRAAKVGRLGKLLARLPSSCPLLYPLYLAAQLDTVEDVYPSPLLPKAFDGWRIAFVTDVHYGVLLGADRVRALADRVNAWQADLVLLGGDYGEDAQTTLEFWRMRPGFQARVCAVGTVGNHDRTPPEALLGQIADAMRADGVHPLINDAMVLKKDGASLALASVDDVFNGQPDLEKTARLCQGADFTVFFPHNPDILPKTYEMPGGPFFQLALCGHTHGGQVALLGHSLRSSSDYGDRYRSGWYRENGVDILVSNGVGTSALPVRFGARPQVHLITLKRA